MNEGYFVVDDQQLIGKPDVQPAYLVNFHVTIQGEDFVITKQVTYKYTDPVKGEVYQPLFVVPSATIAAAPGILLFRKDVQASKPIYLQLNSNKKLNGPFDVHARSAIFNITNKDSLFSLAKNSNKVFPFVLNGEKMGYQKVDLLYGSVHYIDKGDQYAYMAMRSINYDHIPSIRYFYADGIKILNLDLQVAGKKIGYIIGAGDKVPD